MANQPPGNRYRNLNNEGNTSMSESQEDFSKEINDNGFNLIYTNIKRKVSLGLSRSTISNKLEVGLKLYLHINKSQSSKSLLYQWGMYERVGFAGPFLLNILSCQSIT